MSDPQSPSQDTLRRRAEARFARQPSAHRPGNLQDAQDLLHELGVHQAELELQNEALQEAQVALQAARDRFATLYEQAPCGYVILDASGIIRQSNATWRALVNRPEEDFRGRPFAEFLVPEDAPAFLGRFRALFRHPSDKRLLLHLLRRGAEPFAASLEARPGTGWFAGAGEASAGHLLVIVSDISELHQAQQQLETRHRELLAANSRTERLNAILRAIRNVNQLITKEDDPDRLIRQTCLNLTEELSYHQAWVALLDPFEQTVQAFAHAGPAGGFEDFQRRLDRGDWPPCLRQALPEDRLVVVRDPAAECLGCTLAEGYVGRAGLCRRLAQGGRAYGVLSVSVPDSYADDPEEQAFFEELAGDLAFALHKIEGQAILKESQQDLKRAYELAQVGSWRIDLRTGLVHASEDTRRIYGLSSSPIPLAEVQAVPLPEHRAALDQAMRALVEENRPYDVEFRIRRPTDGEIRTIHSIAEFDPPRRIVIGAIQDVTAVHQAREALRQREEFLGTVLQTTPDGFWVIDSQGRVVDVNQAYCAMSGYSREQILSLRIADLDAVERPADTAARIARIRERGSELFESIHRRRDGSLWPVEVSVAWIESGGGRFVCFCRDLSERQQREERIALLGQMLDSAPASITIHEPSGRFLFANRVTATLHGYRDVEEFLAVNLHELDAPASEAAIAERVRRIRLEGEARFEVDHRRRDGTFFPLEVLAKLIEWHGQPAILSIATDISERKQVEAALRESEERFRMLVEAAPMAVMLLQRGCYVYGNPAAVRLLGLADPADLVGLSALDTIAPEYRETVRERIARINQGETNTPFEMEILRPDGGRLWTVTTSVPVLLRGEPTALIVGQDVTERRRAEQERERLQAQLLQAQKMESIGRLAGGVAHDFNNMLCVVLGNTEMVLDRLPPDDPRHADLREAHQAAQRSVEVTRQLLTFARQQPITPRLLDLNEAIEGFLKMLRRLIGEDIDLVWKPAASLGPVLIDPSQLNQILTNLCVNARDAIAGVGTITIETGTGSLDAAFCVEHPEAAPGAYVWLAVRDDGSGISPETRAKLFEPFFTTKPAGRGTGLGLATVYGIVQQNHGAIEVLSEVGRGTTFRIHLPRHAVAAPKAAPGASPPLPLGRGETVLLVEDEPAILRLGRTLLERLRYTVLTAGNPAEALALVEARPDRLDLLVTDVIMPGMNGPDLARRLRERHPGLRVLLMSGYTADAISQHGILDPGVHFLQKPFSEAELAGQVHRALTAE